MKNIRTEVLVIGGGATGAGVARDLAMRGFRTVMVEKGDYTHGTTGRYHGLLHSGGRYVIQDPQAARECREENIILRRIMPQCLEDTGGFFVLTPADNPDYAQLFLEGCSAAHIPVEEVPVALMLQAEPRLNPRISRCFRVPDASADSFLGTRLNIQSAREHGAVVLNYHPVIEFIKLGDCVKGVICHDRTADEQVRIEADCVVNASGAWAGKIAAFVGIQVPIIPSKGVMLAVNHRIVNTVINRCKLPGDGDILVPAHTVAIIGTTDTPAADADIYSIEPWEVELLMEQGEQLIPGFQQLRMLRAWAGLRPLYQEQFTNPPRNVTRAYVLLDHANRDGVEGLITITSGKWTTFRKMAEVTVDLVCQKLGVNRPCRTHLEPLSDPAKDRKYHNLGARLAKIEDQTEYGELVCECELVTRSQVLQAFQEEDVHTIDDLRRLTRLGMGPCQGGFCTYRAVGLLHALRQIPVEDANVAFRDFLLERWKGLIPILWGQQLRQEFLNALLYLSLLNADHLPGPCRSKFSPELYQHPTFPERAAQAGSSAISNLAPQRKTRSYPKTGVDVLIVGAGLSGLAAAWQAAREGFKTKVISQGRGSLSWHAGCIDVLGYYPIGQSHYVESPQETLGQLISDHPDHPYSIAGLNTIEEAILDFKDLCAQAGYPLQGTLAYNWLLPTALGAIRPTCLAPETMVAGDVRQPGSMLIVGFNQFHDFYPAWIAANLSTQGIPAASLSLDIPSLKHRRFVTSTTLAQCFEAPDFIAELARSLRQALRSLSSEIPSRIGLPAVLGLKNSIKILHDLQEQLEMPVFEIPTLPPSIPGLRLQKILEAAIEKHGGVVLNGLQVVNSSFTPAQDSSQQKKALVSMETKAAWRRIAHPARYFILATGGILGGGLLASMTGELTEPITGAPVSAPAHRQDWFMQIQPDCHFLSPVEHPIFQAGIPVNGSFQPATPEGNPLIENLYAIGSLLAGADAIHERSREGIALVSGYVAGRGLF